MILSDSNIFNDMERRAACPRQLSFLYYASASVGLEWQEEWCFLPGHSIVRSCVTKLVNAIFWKRINRLCWKLAHVVYTARTWNDNFGVTRSKVKVTRSNFEVRFGGLAEASFSTVLGRVGFPVSVKNGVFFPMLKLRTWCYWRQRVE